ncbi:MAG: hypothetical protein R2815_07970 [Flavobacteriales bacterium]|nr:hypothetical protein [Flavobacteriales bacterium]
MRTIASRLLLILATVFTMNYVRASEPPATPVPNHIKRASMERALDRALNKNLAFPLLARENMIGEVELSFVINKEGRIEVLTCASQNEALKAYVLRKLARIDIGENPEGIWRTTHMHLNFRPEKA